MLFYSTKLSRLYTHIKYIRVTYPLSLLQQHICGQWEDHRVGVKTESIFLHFISSSVSWGFQYGVCRIRRLAVTVREYENEALDHSHSDSKSGYY